MSKTIQVEAFEYDELAPEARQKARDWYRNGEHEVQWFREAEYITSLIKLAEHFDGKLVDYELDWSGYGHNYAKFEMPEMAREEIMRRLAKLGDYNLETLKGEGDCKLTGCATDETAIDGFRVAAFAGDSLSDCMDAAFKTWFADARSNYDYDFSDEGVSEAIRANEYLFTSEGKRSVTL